MSQQQAISEGVKENIDNLCEVYDDDPSRRYDEFLGYLQEEEQKGVSNPEQRALRRLSLSMKGGGMADTEPAVGVFIGASDAINTSESTIRDAKEYIQNQGKERAVKRGVIKRVPDGAETDRLATLMVDGDEYAVLETNANAPDHGEPILKEDWIRYAHGVAKREESGDQVLFRCVFEGDGQIPAVPDIGTLTRFEASFRESDGNLVYANIDGPVEHDPDAGISLQDVLEEDLDIVDLSEATAENYGRDDLVVTRGAVTYMELAPSGDQSARLTVVDPFDFDSDQRVTVWLPDWLDVDFAEQSDVYVIGRVSPSSDPEYDDSINAVNVHADPEFAVETEDIDDFDDLETEPEDTEDAEGGGDGSADGAAVEQLRELGNLGDEDYNQLRSLAGMIDGVNGNQPKDDLVAELEAVRSDGGGASDAGQPEDEGDEEVTTEEDDAAWEW